MYAHNAKPIAVGEALHTFPMGNYYPLGCINWASIIPGHY